jgi:hypothetical protein
MKNIFTDIDIPCYHCDYASPILIDFCQLFNQNIDGVTGPKDIECRCPACKEACKAIKEQIEVATANIGLEYDGGNDD